MISNSRMQITLLSFLFKKINIIQKGINIKDTLKLYAVLFSCFLYAKAVAAPGLRIWGAFEGQTHIPPNPPCPPPGAAANFFSVDNRTPY